MPLTNREIAAVIQENRYTDVIEYIENFLDIADNKVFLVGDIVAQSHEVLLHLEGYLVNCSVGFPLPGCQRLFCQKASHFNQTLNSQRYIKTPVKVYPTRKIDVPNHN